MRPNTALAFLLSGISLWLLQEGHSNRRFQAAQGLGVVVEFIGLVTLAGYVVGRGGGIDQLLIARAASHPGRMAVLSAIEFVLAGGALFLLGTARQRLLTGAQLLALPIGVISFFGVYDYLLDLDGRATGMAFHTVVAFGLLGLGVLAARPESAIAAMLVRPNVGSAAIRRLLPGSIAALVVLGWLRWHGERQGFYGREFGSALLVTMAVLVLSLLIWNHALSLDRIDEKRKLHERELAKVNRMLRLISECNQAMLHATDERAFLEKICEHIVELGGYRMAWVGLAEQDEEKRVRPVAQAGARSEYVRDANIVWSDTERGRGPLGIAIRTGQPAVVCDTQTDPGFAPWRERAAESGFRSSVALPLDSGGDSVPFGAISIYAADRDAFDSEELELLSKLAGDLAFGMSALRTRNALQARVRQQASIAALSQQALAERSVAGLMQHACELAAGTLDVEYCQVLELLPGGESLLPRAGVGWQPGRAGQATVGAGRGSQAGYTLLNSDPVVVIDLGTETRFSASPLLLDHGVVSGMSVVIQGGDQPYGVLGVHTRARREFGRDDAYFLQTMANVLTIAIVRARTEQTRAHLAAIVESSEDAVVGETLDGWIVSWNPGAERLYGYSAAETVGHSATILVPPQCAADEMKTLERIKLGECASRYETMRLRKDGQPVHVSLVVSPIKDVTGAVVGASAVARDITERKRAEEEVRRLNAELEQRVAERTAELAASNKELEAFTYSVSHDLRAPLRHIDGFSRLLLDQCSEQLPEQGRHYLARIRTGTRQMGALVDDLLNLARLGRREVSVQMTGLKSLVDEVRAALAPESEGRDIEWRVSPLPFVECDPALMKQVFANLLSNAVKFTRPREHAVIEIGSETRDSRRVLFVRDNGVGFNMKYASKLFGVFQRLHRSEDFEGTGVGLATVQRIIQKHGGVVWAEAELDHGATLYFTLGNGAGAADPAAPCTSIARGNDDYR